MEYNIINNEPTIQIVMKDDITFDDYNGFRGIIDNHLNKTRVDHCIIDMKKVGFIDSAGLGMLLLLHEEAANKKIKITIHSGNGQVARMMELAKFDTMFTVVSGAA